MDQKTVQDVTQFHPEGTECRCSLILHKTKAEKKTNGFPCSRIQFCKPQLCLYISTGRLSANRALKFLLIAQDCTVWPLSVFAGRSTPGKSKLSLRSSSPVSDKSSMDVSSVFLWSYSILGWVHHKNQSLKMHSEENCMFLVFIVFLWHFFMMMEDISKEN